MSVIHKMLSDLHIPAFLPRAYKDGHNRTLPHLLFFYSIAFMEKMQFLFVNIFTKTPDLDGGRALPYLLGLLLCPHETAQGDENIRKGNDCRKCPSDRIGNVDRV